MTHNWKKFNDELPTIIEGEQVKILFGHPKWATYIRGLYTHFEGQPLEERISEYESNLDEYWAWESAAPTHWIKLPDNPKD